MQLVDKVLRPNTNVAAIPGEILNLKKIHKEQILHRVDFANNAFYFRMPAA